MSIIRRSPYPGLLSLRDAMDQLFEERFIRPPMEWGGEGLNIAVDMTETDENILIEADLPGVSSDNVDVRVTDSTLTLKGEFQSEEERARGNVYFRERRYGNFQRSIPLPAAIDADAAEAEFEDGVLRITLPKTEETRPRQISVTTKS